MSYTVMPDLEAVAAAALRAENIASGRVYSSIPANATYPLVVVQRIGGVPSIAERQDVARIQVSVWGNNKAEARDAAEAARRVLHELQGTADDTFDAFISAVTDDLGLFFLPDDVTHRDRYIFGVALHGHDYS